ncbi:hypothetical protein U9M48_032027 [Paspalum notatum var. saurae]|uniref:Uncharacterized protein n=1 Tax=Paspalum notatum var. saurae TaxID=547442 RepID=A0AAQ3U476_PASNO
MRRALGEEHQALFLWVGAARKRSAKQDAASGAPSDLPSI